MKRTTLTVKEVASYMGVSKDLVYQLVRGRKIPHFKVGKRILFRIESVQDWMDAQEEALFKRDDQ